MQIVDVFDRLITKTELNTNSSNYTNRKVECSRREIYQIQEKLIETTYKTRMHISDLRYPFSNTNLYFDWFHSQLFFSQSSTQCIYMGSYSMVIGHSQIENKAILKFHTPKFLLISFSYCSFSRNSTYKYVSCSLSLKVHLKLARDPSVHCLSFQQYFVYTSRLPSHPVTFQIRDHRIMEFSKN